MSISMECPSCMNTFSVPDTTAGRKSKCPECQFILFVPRGEKTVGPAAANTPAAAPTTDTVPQVTAVVETQPLELVAAAPPAKKTRSAIKKPAATTARRPPKSDNPFAFDDKEPVGSRRRKSRGKGGVILLAVLALIALGGLVLLAGGAGAGWYFYNQAAQQRQLAEASAQLVQQQNNESKIVPEREPEQKKIDMKDDPKNDPPKNPGGKPIHEPVGGPPNPIDPVKPPQKARLSISCSPLPAAIKAGDQVALHISAKRENCQGDVGIALDAPKGVLLVAYSPKMPAGFDQISATVHVAPNTKNGVYPLKITATLKDLTDVQTLEFKVENPVAVNVPPPEPDKPPLQFLGGAQILINGTSRQGRPDEEILCVALSRDQKFVVFGGHEPGVHVWDLTEKKERFFLTGHMALVTAVAISADNQFIATGDMNGVIYVWDAKTGKEKHRFKVEQAINQTVSPGRITALDFAPLGNTLLASTSSCLRSWDVDSGKQLGSVDGPHEGGKFEPAAAVACALSNGKIATYSPLKSNEEHVYDATAHLLAFAPGAAGLFVVDKSGPKVEFSRYVLGKTKLPLAEAPPLDREDAPTCLAVADKAGIAVFGDSKGFIHGLDVATGKELFKSPAHKRGVQAIAISSDAFKIVSCSRDGSVSFLDLRNSKPGEPVVKSQLTLAPLAAQTVKAGGSGKINVSVMRKDCKGDVRVGVAPPPNVLQVAAMVTLPANSEQIEIPFTVAAAAMPSKYMVQVTVTLEALSDSKMFELTVEKAGEPDKPTLELANAKIVVDGKVYKKHVGSVDCVALSPDKKWAVSGGADGTLRRWNAQKEEEPKTMYTGQFGLSAAAISPDGKWIAFGDVRGNVRLVSADGKETRPLALDKVSDIARRQINRVHSLEFSSKSDVLVAGTTRYFGSWSVETGKQTQALGTVADSASVRFASDDTSVYALTGLTISVVNARVMSPVSLLGNQVGKSSELRATVFDLYAAKQELIAVVKKDKAGELQRINVLTGQPQKLVGFDVPDEIPLRVAVADKAGYVLTGDKHGAIHLWDLDAGRDVLKFPPHKGAVHALAVSADGRKAVSGGVDESVRFYDLRNEKP